MKQSNIISEEFGKNIITKQKKDSILKKIFNAFINPFTANFINTSSSIFIY